MSDKGVSSMGEIFQLGHAAVGDLFEESIEITEKVDGSFFSFGIIDGELRMRSKGQQLFYDAPSAKMFQAGMASVEGIASLLVPGWVYRGEYLAKPKHNTLAYGRAPKGFIALFDIERAPGYHLLAPERLEEANRIGLEMAPVLFDGNAPYNESTLTLIQSFLERESFLGGQKIEGVVIKNFHRFIHGKPMMAKLVSAAFKEKHSTEWKNSNPGKKDVIETIIDIYKHENRWRKAIQHLRDDGSLESSPRDIGPLMKEISLDVLKEEEDSIKEALWKYAWPQISRGVTRGFPEWYKNYLLEESLNERGTEEG